MPLSKLASIKKELKSTLSLKKTISKAEENLAPVLMKESKPEE